MVLDLKKRTKKVVCRPCRRAKLKCDRALPSCGRCTSLNLACAYDQAEYNIESAKKLLVASKKSYESLAAVLRFSLDHARETPPSILSREVFEHMHIQYRSTAYQSLTPVVSPNQLYGLYDLWIAYASNASSDICIRTDTKEQRLALANTFKALSSFAFGLSHSKVDVQSRIRHLVGIVSDMGKTLFRALRYNNEEVHESLFVGLLYAMWASTELKEPMNKDPEWTGIVKDMLRELSSQNEDNMWEAREGIALSAQFLMGLLSPQFLVENAEKRRSALWRLERTPCPSFNQFQGAMITCYAGYMFAFVLMQCTDDLFVINNISQFCPGATETNYFYSVLPDQERCLGLCKKMRDLPKSVEQDRALTRIESLLLMGSAYSLHITDEDGDRAVTYACTGLRNWMLSRDSGQVLFNDMSVNEVILALEVLLKRDKDKFVDFLDTTDFLNVKVGEMSHRGRSAYMITTKMFEASSGRSENSSTPNSISVAGSLPSSEQKVNSY